MRQNLRQGLRQIKRVCPVSDRSRGCVRMCEGV